MPIIIPAAGIDEGKQHPHEVEGELAFFASLEVEFKISRIEKDPCFVAAAGIEVIVKPSSSLASFLNLALRFWNQTYSTVIAG